MAVCIKVEKQWSPCSIQLGPVTTSGTAVQIPEEGILFILRTEYTFHYD